MITIQLLRLDIEGIDRRIKRIDVNPSKREDLDKAYRLLIGLEKDGQITAENSATAMRLIGTNYNYSFQDYCAHLAESSKGLKKLLDDMDQAV